MPINLSAEEIRRKQQIFKNEFIEAFDRQLELYHGTGTGKKAAEVQYSPGGYIAKSLIINIFGKAINSVPVVGPFAASLLSSAPVDIYEYYQRKQQSREAADHNDYIIEMGEGIVKSVIEETAHEIVRIFEYQITMLKTNTNIQKLANFAVDKIFKAANNNRGNLQFSRDDLLKALVNEDVVSILEKASLKAMQEQTLDTLTSSVWQMRNVFTKPGLREEIDGGGYTYKVKAGSEKEKIKYGYRAKILSWDNTGRTFTHSELDKGYTQDPPTSTIEADARSYIPFMRLVLQGEIEHYYNIYLPSKLINGERTKFSEFFNEINFHNPQAGRIAVFRDVDFRSRNDWSHSDFSNTDLMRIVFANANMQNCIFSNSYMALAEFNLCDLRNSWLKGTDLRWSKISSTNMRGYTILAQANFDYTLFDKETDLTDNNSFGTAVIEKAIIITEKITSSVLDRLSHIEHLLVSIRSELDELNVQSETKLTEWYFSNVDTERLPKNSIYRDEQLDQLAIFFASRDDSTVQILGGLPGVGKTHIVKQYINKFKENYESRIRWFDARTDIELSEQFKRFAKDLCIIVEGRTIEQIQINVREILANKVERSLLIFDDVLDPEQIVRYLPSQSGNNKHHVIITTSNARLWYSFFAHSSSHNIIKVSSFNQQEVRDYIATNMPIANEEEIQMLEQLFREQFDNIPLGISQSIGDIIDADIDIREYLNEYSKVNIDKRAKMQNPTLERGNGHTTNIYESISQKLDLLLQESQKAFEFLKIVSFIHNEDIPISLFDRFFDSSSMFENQKRIFSILEGYFFISILPETHREEKVFSIFKPVQDTVILRINNDIWQSFLGCLELVFDRINLNLDYIEGIIQTDYQQIFRHVASLSKHYDDLIKQKEIDLSLKFLISENMAKLYSVCGKIYFVKGAYQDALSNYQNALSIYFEIYSKDHELTLFTQKEIADMQHMLQSDNSQIIAYVTEIKFDNIILTYPQLLDQAWTIGGKSAVDNLIDLGQDKELSSAIIDAIETYGTRHVVDIIFGLREASLDTTSTKLDNQVLMITANNQYIPEPSRAKFSPNNLMLPSLILKESIEALPTIRYFIKEVLQINYELPKFIDNNYFKLTSHFVVCNLGMFAITERLDIATASIPTALYGGRILAYEYLSKQKQINFYSTEDKSIDSPIEFIQRCGFDIAAQTMFAVISGFVSSNPVIIYDVAISSTVGGMQCYILYKSYNTQGNTKTSAETIIPYIADSIAYYSTVQNMHFDMSSTAGQILAVKQGFTVLSTVVMTDYITKLSVSSISESLRAYSHELINNIYSYLVGETDNNINDL